MHTNYQKQKTSSPTNSLITLTNSRIRKFPHKTPFTVNCLTVTLSEPITQTMLAYWKVDWPQNKLLSNWNYESHHLLELRFISACNRYGSTKKWVHSAPFCSSIAMKIVRPFLKKCRNWLLYTTGKVPIGWGLVVHYQTWPTFVYRNLQMQNSIAPRRQTKTS